jgi:hypothetical protein
MNGFGDGRLLHWIGIRGVRRGVSKGVEEGRRLPAFRAAVRPFQGWPTHRVLKGRARQALTIL